MSAGEGRAAMIVVRRQTLEVGVPTIYRFGAYRFRFYSREHEPPHVHVVSPGCKAIVMLDPVRVIKVEGYTGRQEKEIERLTLENGEDFLRRWHEHFHR